MKFTETFWEVCPRSVNHSLFGSTNDRYESDRSVAFLWNSPILFRYRHTFGLDCTICLYGHKTRLSGSCSHDALAWSWISQFPCVLSRPWLAGSYRPDGAATYWNGAQPSQRRAMDASLNAMDLYRSLLRGLSPAFSNQTRRTRSRYYSGAPWIGL